MPSRTLYNLLALLSLTLCLAACGGGGGGAAPVVPPLEVLATYPADNAQDVMESSEIRIDVSVDIDPAADLASHLGVRTSGGPVAGTWSYNDATRRLTFVPTSGLPIGSEHTVDLMPGLPLAAGGHSAESFAFGFETRAPAFEDAKYLETVSDTAVTSIVKAHPNGNGIALYGVVRSTGNTEYSARFKPAGEDFEARKPLVQVNGERFGEQSVAVNARGDAVWAWKRANSNGDLGYYMVYDRATDDWSNVGLFQSWSGRTMGTPRVAIDDDGNAFFGWQEMDTNTGDTRVGARRRTAAGVLEDYAYFDDEVGSAGTMFVRANARGDAAVSWQQLDATGVTSAYAAYYEAGTGWQSQHLLETFSARSCWMRGLAVAPNGTTVALLAQNDGPTSYEEVPHLATYVPSGEPNPGWQAPVPVSADRGELSDYGMYVTADNRFYAVYSLVEDASDVGYVRAVRYVPATGAIEPILLSAPQIVGVDGGDLEVSLTPGGELLATWTETTTDPEDTLKAGLVRRDGTVVPNLLLRRITGTETINDIAVAAGPGGGGLVVWTEPDTALGGAARTLPGVHIAPDGLVGSVDFLNTTPGDVAEAPAVHLDAMGLGTLVWFQENAATDHTDVRYRTVR